MAISSLRGGEVLENRFRLEECLGQGGFGEVWKATDLRLKPRPVAVKFIKVGVQTNPAMVERFGMEARALAILSHPNIVSIVDRGEESGRHYIVMEYLSGNTLAAWIEDYRSRGAWPDPNDVLSIFDQVASAVEAAHCVQCPGPIIHRDLKSANIFLSPGPRRGDLYVKVVDFGLAQLGERLLTPSGMAMGTPAYMAPEQACGEVASITPATDVFSLGVILIELLTLEMQSPGRAPWWLEVIRSRSPDALALDRMRPGLPNSIWEVVGRALSHRPEDRFQRAGDMRAAVLAARQDALRVIRAAPRVSLSHLDQLRLLEHEAEHCKKCPLSQSRKTVAFSRGAIPARVMFLGEAPGSEEDQTGISFSGPAGQLLDRMIAAMGLSLDEVYITDVIKCKPPKGRLPAESELDACRPYWRRQVELVAPKIIVPLGKVATKEILDTTESFPQLRGRWASYEGISTIATYHPTFLLRNPDAKEDAWEHLKMVMRKLESP